jgi:hypothetical protein
MSECCLADLSICTERETYILRSSRETGGHWLSGVCREIARSQPGMFSRMGMREEAMKC